MGKMLLELVEKDGKNKIVGTEIVVELEFVGHPQITFYDREGTRERLKDFRERSDVNSYILGQSHNAQTFSVAYAKIPQEKYEEALKQLGASE